MKTKTAAVVCALAILMASLATPAFAQEDDAPTSPITAVYLVALNETAGSSSGDHDATLTDSGIAPSAKLYDYTAAFNGFAAELTTSEAQTLRSAENVAAVEPDQLRTIAGADAPGYLGIDHQQGPWATGFTGDGIVIGVIDTGISADHPSFEDRGNLDAPTSFRPTGCDLPIECTDKIVSAVSFSHGVQVTSEDPLAITETTDATDTAGHGTHVASIAAGNRNVEARVSGASLGTLAGVAPDAGIAVYKACFETTTGVHCSLADLVAAIDTAILDGVDVLNYSVSPGDHDLELDDLAFLAAEEAGIMVATAAGNDDENRGVPWVASVGAATIDTSFVTSLELSTGLILNGTGLGAGASNHPIVMAPEANVRCAEPFAIDLEAQFVVCAAGSDPTLQTSNASAADAAGVILLHGTSSAGDVSHHPIPTIALSAEASQALTALAAAETDSLSGLIRGARSVPSDAAQLASFSPTGVNAINADILKPDFVAPGVSILGAARGGEATTTAIASGTSIASAHVAGVYALIRQAQPLWTPAMVRSALATGSSNSVLLSDGETIAGATAIGNGYIQPGGNIHARGSAFNPGLVYDISSEDYAGFICGASLDQLWDRTACGNLGAAIEASALNLPSITVSNLVESKTITRTVTSVADKLRVFEAQINAPDGFTVEVSPGILTLAPGETATFSVTISHAKAPGGVWRDGSVTWRSSGYRVETPVVVRASALNVDALVAATGQSGDTNIDVQFGYTGAYSASPVELQAAEQVSLTIEPGGTQDFRTDLATGAGVGTATLSLDEDTVFLRIAATDAAALYVYDGDTLLTTSDGTIIDLSVAGAATLTVVAHGNSTSTEAVDVDLDVWKLITDTESERLSVDAGPARANVGDTADLSLGWSDLTEGELYVGGVIHEDGNDVIGFTVVTIDTDPANTTGTSEPRRFIAASFRIIG